jgi:hypothetical protein
MDLDKSLFIECMSEEVTNPGLDAEDGLGSSGAKIHDSIRQACSVRNCALPTVGFEFIILDCELCFLDRKGYYGLSVS